MEISLVIPKGLQLRSGAQHTLFCYKISFVASYAHMGGWGVGHDTPQK